MNSTEQLLPKDSSPVAPIFQGPGEGKALWAFDTLGTVKASADSTGGVLGLIEQLAPRGSGSPLHIHTREDEWFYVIEGELTFWVGGETIAAPAGSFVFGPRNIPHTFVVSSDQARFLLGTNPGGFENFMAAAGVPAERLEVPPPADGPPDVEAMTAAAASFGIQIIGPPGIPEGEIR